MEGRKTSDSDKAKAYSVEILRMIVWLQTKEGSHQMKRMEGSMVICTWTVRIHSSGLGYMSMTFALVSEASVYVNMTFGRMIAVTGYAQATSRSLSTTFFKENVAFCYLNVVNSYINTAFGNVCRIDLWQWPPNRHI